MCRLYFLKSLLNTIFIVSFLVFPNALFGQEKDEKPLNEKPLQNSKIEELEFIKKRFNKEYAGWLSQNLWTFTHDYTPNTKVKEVLKLLQDFFYALQTQKEEDLQKVGGLRGFKETFAGYLKSDDDTLRGFAASILAIIGDKSYSPQIAELLKTRDRSFYQTNVYPLITYRGRAAVALWILEAKKYAPQIADLLKSQNGYDRKGAVMALGGLKATKYAENIVQLLTDEKFDFPDDDSPIYFLVENQLAPKYKNEIVRAMLSKYSTNRSKTAAYALAFIQAQEHAPEVAKLLKSDLRQGFAAKVLALLGAKEYSGEIAKLLPFKKTDKNDLVPFPDKLGFDPGNSRVQKDAALALGILKAKKYAPQVSKLLSSKEDYVRHAAAVSLIMMEAGDFQKKAFEVLTQTRKSGARLKEDDFHPLVLERARKIIDKFNKLTKFPEPSGYSFLQTN